MGGKIWPKAVALVGILAFYATEAVRVQSPTLPNFGAIGKALTVVALVVALSDTVLWHLAPARIRPPKVGGSWKMKADDGAISYLVVWQTASTVTASLYWADGTSKTTTAVLVTEGRDQSVRVFYDFEPSDATAGNDRRKGAASFAVMKHEGGLLGPWRRARRLEGKYWNDAKHVEGLKSDGYSRMRRGDYEAAAGLSYRS